MYAAGGAHGADEIFEGGFFKAFAGASPADDVVKALGTRFHIDETYVKVHGGCRGNHAPVDAVSVVIRDHDVRAQDIRRIVLRVDSVTYAADIHAPLDGTQAQFSAPFAVASMLVFGDASSARYTDASLADPLVRELMQRIEVEVEHEFDEGYPDIRPAAVEITMVDGQTHSGYVRNARGEPEDPFTHQEIEDKFYALMRGVLPDGGAQLRDLVMGLEGVSDVAVLAGSMTCAPDGFLEARHRTPAGLAA
jgi:2-methylcitrate dehydratase PrpD